MKRILNLLLFAAVLMCGASILTSCDDVLSVLDNPASDEPEVLETDYTVMLYTVGGGNLDSQIETDIKRAANAIKADSKKVRYLVQYKYSSQAGINKSLSFTPSGKAGHVYRYEASPSIVNTEKSPALLLKDDYLYGTQHEKAEFFQPDSIANFIKYCKKVAPAKNYILVFSDHGGGYSVNQDYLKSLEKVGTRGLVFDDNLGGRGITCKEIRTALETSGIHLTMLYFDCCLMNNMETLSELTELTDYVLASGHTNAGETTRCLSTNCIKPRQATHSPRPCQDMPRPAQNTITTSGLYRECHGHVMSISC